MTFIAVTIMKSNSYYDIGDFMVYIVRFILVISIFLNTGCVGTFMTRFDNDFFGSYPFLAAYYDLQITGACLEEPSFLAVPAFFIALPIDFAVDAVFMPIDLVCWAAGKEKDYSSFKP